MKRIVPLLDLTMLTLGGGVTHAAPWGRALNCEARLEANGQPATSVKTGLNSNNDSLLSTRRWILAVLVAALACIAVPLLNGSTLTVTTAADSGAGSLRERLAAAGSGDTIVFNVTGTITLISGELVLNRSLNIVGPGANQLALSGNNASRIFWVSNGTAIINVSIAALTLREGVHQQAAFGFNGQGGAIYNGPQAALAVSNCSFVANAARGAAGVGNTRPGGTGGNGWGGSIYNAASSAALTLVGCTFQNNQAVGGAGGNGISGGNAGGNGGAGGQGAGGAVCNDGLLRMINCTFSANSALGASGGTGGGGAVFDGNGGNGGNGDGGQVANRGDGVAIHATIVGGTTAGGVGGAGEIPGAAGLARGGGWFAAGTSNALLNTLVAQNSAAGGGSNVFGAVTSLGHNLIGVTNGSSGWVTGDLSGSVASPLNPQLGPLADNGGATPTHAPIAPASPAIDAADATVTGPPYQLTVDQRGVARQLGAGPDIGAVEVLICPQDALAEFTLDPALSRISMSGRIASYPIIPQGAGSLTTTYSGTLRALVSSNSIGFPGGSSIRAANNGSWSPLPGGGDGVAPANYGAAAADPSLVLFASYGAIRNLVLDLTSPCLPLIDGAFAANGLPFLPVGNPAPTEDIRVALPISFSTSYPLSSPMLNQVNTPAGLQTAGGIQTLTLPVHTEILISSAIPFLASGDSLLVFEGTLVARRIIEPPIMITSAGVTNGIFSMRWTSVSGGSYRVESTTNFVNWQIVASSIPATGNSTSWSKPASRPAEFFRVGRN